jgi:hypothetical protein
LGDFSSLVFLSRGCVSDLSWLDSTSVPLGFSSS